MTTDLADMTSTTRLRARAGATAATPSGSSVAQFGLGWGFGQVYSHLIAPTVRTAVNKVVGDDSPTIRPPLTPGWLARDLVQASVGHLVNQAVIGGVLKSIGAGQSRNPLLQAAGAASAAMGGLGPAQAGAALLGTTVALSAVGVVLDQVWARTMGTRVEDPINRAFGINKGATERKDTRGNVPVSTIKMTVEEGSRQFARNVAGGLAYNIAWNAFGTTLARTIGMGIGGPAGAVVGAIGGMLLTSAITHGAIWAVGEPVADGAQAGVRLLKSALGMKLDPERTRGDVLTSIGDRVAGDIQGVLVPAATAASTGQMGAFIGGLSGGR